MKKALKMISNIITAVLFINLILMAILVVSSKASGGEPQAFGYQLKTVLSGSMEPTFQTGSVIAVKPLSSEERKSLKKDDVITFQASEEKLITHRVIGVSSSGDHVMYETKGDNNKTADMEPVLSENVRAVYTGFTIPYVGYFIDFAQSKEGSAILLIGPGLLLLGYAAFSIFQTIREIDPKSSKTDSEEKTA
ncbi:signal peptidase I [Cytobacillus oceanisediminis]|uniref:signal peptidase I SipW n=1 Tax=Cytobacillus TaxID=2675230 RepID=UPI00203D90A7|nr:MULTISPECIES: signal peptidase I [Cytobacillus]MBY0155869.1 signal peptidase I [Cytobacillus firmus]MCM3390890.1 signal peptidase I [Cytobacillus oceanisediminis]MCM3531779.1 signal peptidase I [Cytobacillus oceanisediminis]UQX52531.1 signal peptidase I [Cytobacillus pseudoceanisediminis]